MKIIKKMLIYVMLTFIIFFLLMFINENITFLITKSTRSNELFATTIIGAILITLNIYGNINKH